MLSKIFQKLIQIFKIRDLRKSILFVLAMLIVFRIAAHIPLTGVDLESLKRFFTQNEILGFMNLLTGGGMSNFSLVALGVGPYITASIIIQLLTMIVPSLEELAKEGEAGYHKINQYTRLLAVPMAALQSYGMIVLLSNSSGQKIISNLGIWQLSSMIITMTAGCVFLMWLGELISEKKIGNGISLIIFAGIVSGLPSVLQQTVVSFDSTKFVNLLIFIILGLITVAGVVIITEGQRNIPISYARRVRGNKMYGGASTYLPLRVNQAGMIPIIFAISIVLFPPIVAQLLMKFQIGWLKVPAEFIYTIFQPSHYFYGIAYFVLVVAFTYFYTAVVFHPQKIAENLQKQGGFILGIRPGKPTSQYISNVSQRIMLAGATSLGIIAILPLITGPIFEIRSIALGGAGLLIIVSVVLETIKQIESQLTMREYEGL
ncbi:preprotein translocase subunit SecY [Candidatus Kuenenbacteria bacterium HGW-Kuenenbacteria-1]|uniref:Protein translocase subunit SecY n=1 Tax=Candidatus Kuenenbacteria bacterium HGW-Kuenenbacteria-1 TaxID=2013812 RepID=A0A2N1UP70_9BACT|nr:MAG: preprotein translocase subunit SecY [Candidatus Kuenenbacteria bacterium HGW-Kuenenbacteria-1]